MREFINIVLNENVIQLGRHKAENNTVPKDIQDVLARFGFEFIMVIGDVPSEALVGYQYRNGKWTIEIGVKQQRVATVAYLYHDDKEIGTLKDVTPERLTNFLGARRYKNKTPPARMTKNDVVSMLLKGGFRNVTGPRMGRVEIPIGDQVLYSSEDTEGLDFANSRHWIIHLVVRASDQAVLSAGLFDPDHWRHSGFDEVTPGNISALIRRSKGWPI